MNVYYARLAVLANERVAAVVVQYIFYSSWHYIMALWHKHVSMSIPVYGNLHTFFSNENFNLFDIRIQIITMHD